MKTLDQLFKDNNASGMACEYGYSCEVVSLELAIKIANEYAEQFKPKWIPVYPRTKELYEMMDNKDSRLVQCLFDTGEILALNDDHPFAIMTHVCFLPELPPKILTHNNEG